MIEITNEVLDPVAVAAKVSRGTNGAVVTFLGVTRNFTGDRQVLRLAYEAYRPMADTKLAEVADEMRNRWPVEVAISHRLGTLEIGEASLVVAVGSPHRKDAFEACHYSIDRIKQIVPIWKKEFFADGEVWVGSQEDFRPLEPAQSSRPNAES